MPFAPPSPSTGRSTVSIPPNTTSSWAVTSFTSAAPFKISTKFSRKTSVTTELASSWFQCEKITRKCLRTLWRRKFLTFKCRNSRNSSISRVLWQTRQKGGQSTRCWKNFLLRCTASPRRYDWVTVIIQMAWYDKGKTPEWRTLIDRPYSLETLIHNKDLLLQ